MEKKVTRSVTTQMKLQFYRIGRTVRISLCKTDVNKKYLELTRSHAFIALVRYKMKPLFHTQPNELPVINLVPIIHDLSGIVVVGQHD
jgi:hypothetical protein